MENFELIKSLGQLLMKNWKENNDQTERDLLFQMYNELVPEVDQVFQETLPYFEAITEDLESDEHEFTYRCGCGTMYYDDMDASNCPCHDHNCEPLEPDDSWHDADALASAGFGTDEDYGDYFGAEFDGCDEGY